MTDLVPAFKGYEPTMKWLEDEHMITIEVMNAKTFDARNLYDLRIPTSDFQHDGMLLPQSHWDRVLKTVRERNKTDPRQAGEHAVPPPVAPKHDDSRITHAALKEGIDMIIPPPGFVGMKDRGARQSMSMARYTDARWKPKLGSFQDKRKELWDALSVDAQAMFSADMDPIDVTTLPVLAQKAIVNVYETHCGPLVLLWLQMWVFEKTDTCVTRYSIHQSIMKSEDRLDKVITGIDDTKEPRKRGRDVSPRIQV